MKRFMSALAGVLLLPLFWSTSWAQVNRILPPPEGGKIEALGIDPFNPLVIYAGTFVGGVFKSTDGGDTWLFLPTTDWTA